MNTELEKHVQVRTGKRVRNLEIQHSPEGIILLGEAGSYHVKQLAQHGVLDILPSIRLHNRITVHYGEAV
jgi:hypothetical protein